MLTDPLQVNTHSRSEAKLDQGHAKQDGEGMSEVARLRRLIALEYEAAQRGLAGLAQGAAQHAFLNARMCRVSEYDEQLALIVGEAEATRIVCELYAETLEQ